MRSFLRADGADCHTKLTELAFTAPEELERSGATAARLNLTTAGAASPFNAFQLIQGIETLALRGKAHSQNANELAAWLAKHPMIKKVSHPSLDSHPSHERAKKYFRNNCYGSVLTFEIKGSAPREFESWSSSLFDPFEGLSKVGDAFFANCADVPAA